MQHSPKSSSDDYISTPNYQDNVSEENLSEHSSNDTHHPQTEKNSIVQQRVKITKK